MRLSGEASESKGLKAEWPEMFQPPSCLSEAPIVAPARRS